MTNHVHELLTRAQNLIRDPKNWTTDAYARTSDGMALRTATDTRGVCFCSAGALQRVGHDYAAAKLLALAMGGVGRATIITFNDSHTHDEVMAAWDRALELAAG